MPKFSIVIPVYNVEDYIERCLESIKKQTFKDYEVIVVNDGTKDNSMEIVKKYSYTISTIIFSRICIFMIWHFKMVSCKIKTSLVR